MSIDSDDWVVVGRFGRVHGLKGYITVHSFTEPRDNILQYSPWHTAHNQQWHALDLQEVSARNKDILVKIEGYADCDQVAKFTNADIAVRREQLPGLSSGEFYWHQLTGMQVINLQNVVLGTLTEMMATGSNDVMVVDGDRRHLVPYLPEHTVVKVDLLQNRITVDWDADF